MWFNKENKEISPRTSATSWGVKIISIQGQLPWGWTNQGIEVACLRVGTYKWLLILRHVSTLGLVG